MKARVFAVQFSADMERTIDVRATTADRHHGTANAADFPSDLVAAVRDWADAGLQGIHEDYRVPSRLVAYLNEVVAEGGESSRATVASTVLEMLNLAPEGGN